MRRIRRSLRLKNARQHLPSPGQLVRENFFSGFLILLPFAIVVWIFLKSVQWIWSLREILPASLQPEQFFAGSELHGFFEVVFFGLIVAFLIILLSFWGWFSKRYLGKKVLEAISVVILRIPFIRSIYSALNQLLRSLSDSSSRQFSRVVYIEYPRKGIWALAFVTGEAKGPNVPSGHLNVYLPTTPNPTSGFHLLVSNDDVRESGMTVEQAFKTLLSLGLAQPEGPK